MTNKEIKKGAFHSIVRHSDVAAIASLYFFTAMVLMFLAELGLTVIMKMSGYRDYMVFSVSFYEQHHLAVFLLLLRVSVYWVVFTVLSYLVTRSFMVFDSEGSEDSEEHTKRFLAGHIKRMILPNLRSCLSLLILKLIAASPAIVSVQLMARFYMNGVRGELKLGSLFAFMLATGFTIVWGFMTVRYYMSLCLVPYITGLNPRANFFDACDLSVKLMDGNHMRLIHMTILLIPSLLSGVLFYPLMIIYPFVTECRRMLAKEIMGGYWQDKIPAMARRWQKQMARMGR